MKQDNWLFIYSLSLYNKYLSMSPVFALNYVANNQQTNVTKSVPDFGLIILIISIVFVMNLVTLKYRYVQFGNHTAGAAEGDVSGASVNGLWFWYTLCLDLGTFCLASLARGSKTQPPWPSNSSMWVWNFLKNRNTALIWWTVLI